VYFCDMAIFSIRVRCLLLFKCVFKTGSTVPVVFDTIRSALCYCIKFKGNFKALVDGFNIVPK